MVTATSGTDLLDQLARFDTPTVCNVIELWDLRPRNEGYMDQSIESCFPEMPPMVGYAVTTTFRARSAPRDGDVYSGLNEQIESFSELPGPAVLVFQDLDEPTAAATFGEVMCSTYKAFEARGIVTSGTGRDLDQVRDLGFPAFTNGTSCAHGYCHMLSTNVPVTVGGIVVDPGELLHGDCNGVTTIPSEIASEIPSVCEDFMKAEQVVLDFLKGDDLNPTGYAEARAECGAMIAALGQRVRGEN